MDFVRFIRPKIKGKITSFQFFSVFQLYRIVRDFSIELFYRLVGDEIGKILDISFATYKLLPLFK